MPYSETRESRMLHHAHERDFLISMYALQASHLDLSTHLCLVPSKNGQHLSSDHHLILLDIGCTAVKLAITRQLRKLSDENNHKKKHILLLALK